MGFYKPTEGNPLRTYVGRERTSVQSCHLLPSTEAQGPCMQMPRPTGPRTGALAQATNCRSQQNTAVCSPPPHPTPTPCFRKQRSEEDMVRKISKDSSPPLPILLPLLLAHHLPKVCSLSPLLNPNSDKRPEPPMRLSLRAPKCARRVCLKMTS